MMAEDTQRKYAERLGDIDARIGELKKRDELLDKLNEQEVTIKKIADKIQDTASRDDTNRLREELLATFKGDVEQLKTYFESRLDQDHTIHEDILSRIQQQDGHIEQRLTDISLSVEEIKEHIPKDLKTELEEHRVFIDRLREISELSLLKSELKKIGRGIKKDTLKKVEKSIDKKVSDSQTVLGLVSVIDDIREETQKLKEGINEIALIRTEIDELRGEQDNLEERLIGKYTSKLQQMSGELASREMLDDVEKRIEELNFGVNEKLIEIISSQDSGGEETSSQVEELANKLEIQSEVITGLEKLSREFAKESQVESEIEEVRDSLEALKNELYEVSEDVAKKVDGQIGKEIGAEKDKIEEEIKQLQTSVDERLEKMENSINQAKDGLAEKYENIIDELKEYQEGAPSHEDAESIIDNKTEEIRNSIEEMRDEQQEIIETLHKLQTETDEQLELFSSELSNLSKQTRKKSIDELREEREQIVEKLSELKGTVQETETPTITAEERPQETAPPEEMDAAELDEQAKKMEEIIKTLGKRYEDGKLSDGAYKETKARMQNTLEERYSKGIISKEGYEHLMDMLGLGEPEESVPEVEDVAEEMDVDMDVSGNNDEG